MKKMIFLSIFMLVLTQTVLAQQTFYNVTPGNGNGLAFWSDGTYKIHMGTGAEYFYGPVQDYSIKMNMSAGTPSRGWTWGVISQAPVAAINTLGNMQIAGNFVSAGDIKAGSSTINSNSNYLAMMKGVGAVDGSYEWTGFYSGNTRQGIILYDGAWTGANGLTNEFSISAEAGNKLTLNTQGPDIALMPKGGNVGIGTTTPAAKLEVVGPITGNGATIRASGGGDVLLNSGGSVFFDGNYSYASGNYIRPVSSNTQSYFTSGVERMRIDATGNIGIGTTTPDAKLAVKGQIHAQEVKVDLLGSIAPPDYVFASNYQLPTLDYIKTYIDQNKHLPEIPSAKEIETNGVNLGEMNMLLLKKIEELTLYQIETKQIIEALISRIKILETKSQQK